MTYTAILSTVPPNPWPVMTLAARSGPWLTYTPRLFMNAFGQANLRARWTDPTNKWATLKAAWGIFGTNSHLIMAQCLDYQATGNTANVGAAVTMALAQMYNSDNEYGIDDVTQYIPYCAFVLDWMWPALSTGQRSSLAAQVSAFCVKHEAALNSLTFNNYFPARSYGNYGYCATVIAGYNESGFVNGTRLTQLRNFVQNQQMVVDECFSDGAAMTYQIIGSVLPAGPIIMYHIASGEQALISSRCSLMKNRGKFLARMVMSNGHDYWCNDCNQRPGAGGQIDLDPDLTGSQAAVYAYATRDPLIQWVCEQQQKYFLIWSKNQPMSEATYLAFMFYDLANVGQAAQSTLPTSANFPTTGVTNIRGGWNLAADVNIWFYAGPNFGPWHDSAHAGDFQILCGETQLIVPGYTYPGRPTGWDSWPPGQAPGANSITKNCMGFEPAGGAPMMGDFSGGQANSVNSSAFPLNDQFTGGTYTPKDCAKQISFTDDGTLAQVVADLAAAYPQVTSPKTTFAVKRQGVGKATVVIYEQFTAGAGIDHIRRNFWSPPGVKPKLDNETVLQGTTNAGYLASNSNKLVIINGASQVTIQLTTPMITIDLVGGPGFESVFNLAANNPVTKAGNNQGDLSTSAIARMTGIWRASFRTDQGRSPSNMMYVLTIDAAGTVAPLYTTAQALAILSAVAPPPPPPPPPNMSVALTVVVKDAGGNIVPATVTLS